MRKNDNDSTRGSSAPSGGRPRSSGTGKRDGKPRVGGGFKPRTNRATTSSFGDRTQGSATGTTERSAGGYRDSRSPESGSSSAGGFGEKRKSPEWGTGGYRITKKGVGKSIGGFKGQNKDAAPRTEGFRGPKRDAAPRTEGFRGPRRDAEPRTEGFRGPGRDAAPRAEGFRGPGRDAAPRAEGFRGPRRDAAPRTEGFRGPGRDSAPRTEGFRGPGRDAAPRAEGFRGPRKDAAPRAEGFRGPRKDSAPRAGGFRDSKRSFENKGPRAPINKQFDNQSPKEDAYTKKEVIKDNVDGDEYEHEDRVEGRNSVFEALRSGRPLNKLFIEKDSEDPMLSRIVAMAREKDVPVQYFERFKLDSMSQTRSHQGVILEVAAQEYVEVEDILAKAAEKEEKPFVLVLDSITDTNNLGSIIRSAECSGVHGIIIPKRRSATLNATVAKVAAGALEYVPVARVSNLVQTIRQLKAAGLWIIGADMEGASNYYETDLKGPCALVIGSEGEGLARLVKEECDLMVKIPMKGKIPSLNAGVAAALIMFEISKQRG